MAVAVLLQHPEQLSAVLADPRLIPDVIEEVLRFESPVQVATTRFTTEPISIAGQQIPAGAMVFASVLAAGRDRRHIDRSNSFELGRGEHRHVTFGYGIHYCLGAQLARVEAAVALERLLTRFPGLQLAVPVATLTWRPSVLMNGLLRLPVTLH